MHISTDVTFEETKPWPWRHYEGTQTTQMDTFTLVSTNKVKARENII